MAWPQQQVDELAYAAHHHPTPGVRIKVLAVRAVAMGRTRTEAAEFCATTRQSVADWVKRYQAGGVEALMIAPGRGRKSHIDEQQLVDYALQSPRNFGIGRSRWRIKDLAQAVPTLEGMSLSGVWQALKRCGLRYKRGQPWCLSPDPAYEKKRQVIAAALEHARRYPGTVVAVFQDEASFYRQPSQAGLWGWVGRLQPHMKWSHRSNTLVRAAAWLDALTGCIGVLQTKKIDVKHLLRSYRELLEAYPDALMIYVIQDNWPVHLHKTVLEFLAEHPRLQLCLLPTYAPRLNSIEKLWRWTRQKLCHAHPFCDDFNEYKAQLAECFVEAQHQPAEIGHYCGLDSLASGKLFSA